MAPYRRDSEGTVERRQIGLTSGVVVLALTLTVLPDLAQQRVAGTLRETALRPFIALQQGLTQARVRAGRIEELMEQMDSLTSRVSTQGALIDENRTLRGLLGLSGRAVPLFHPATVLRPGTAGSESMFLVDVGSNAGVRVGAPVVNPDGLVGVIREVRAESALGMDWTHPDFRASAMLLDGSDFGIVENRRGAFREQDRLVLNGTAYNEDVPDGTLVLTSGLGGVFPRGIPVGRIDGVAEVQGTWLKSYWLRPVVQPGSVTHVLVEIVEADGSLEILWPQDSAQAGQVTERVPGP